MFDNNENMNENNNNKLIHSLKYIFFLKEHCFRVCFLQNNKTKKIIFT